MLRIIMGRARSGKTARAVSEISERVRNGSGFSYYIVPEQYSHEAERELCRAAGDTLAVHAETTSFSHLYHSLTTELGGGAIRFLDKGGKILALVRAYEAALPGLRVLGRGGIAPETLPALSAAMDELSSARLTKQAVGEMSGRVDGALGNKLCDLALIHEAYKAVCAQGKADPGSLLDRLAELVSASAAMKGAAVYIDGFIDFTEQEYTVIDAMLAVCGDITVCLTCDGLGAGSEVHDLSRYAAYRIIELAKARSILVEVEEMSVPDTESPLDFLGEQLFTYMPETRDCGGAVRLFRAASRGEECEFAAAEALRLVRETGCRFRDIAIVIRGAERYRAALTAVFAYYGVPLYMGRKSGLGEKPLSAFLKHAFEIIFGGWDGEAVSDYIRTGLAGISAGEADLLENYIYIWNIKGFGFSSGKPWTKHPRGLGLEMEDRDAERLKLLNNLRARVTSPLIGLSEGMRESEIVRGHAAAVAEFLTGAKLPATLSDLARRLANAGEARLAAEYSQVWEVIVNALEQTDLMLGDFPMGGVEFSRLFLLVLSQYSVGTIPQALDTVTAGDMDRMRRRNIKHLFVLGASGDNLPAEVSSPGVLTELERASLADAGMALHDSANNGLLRELNLIYNCLTMPSDTLTMSYPTSSSEGVEATPSYIYERVARLFSLEAKGVCESYLRTFAPRPAMELAVSVCEAGDSGSASAARAYFLQRPEGERLLSIEDAARQGRGRLSERAVQILYGKSPRLSSSRIEEFAGCRFRYFMNYGLRLVPKARAEFSAPEAGSFVHYLLEGTTREIMGGIGFENADSAFVDSLSDKYIERYIKEKLDGLRDADSRFSYLFSRLAMSGRRIVRDTVDELARSDFRPLAFELEFRDIPASGSGENVYLSGKVDRLDGYRKGGKLYIRVVDYKSGKKEFSLRDILGGQNMQMLLYLFALGRSGEAIFGEPCVPAGALYVPSRDAFIVPAKRGESEESVERARRKSLRRHGLILNDSGIICAMERGEEKIYLPFDGRSKRVDPASLADAEQLESLRDYVRRSVSEHSERIRGGHIEANPMEPDRLCGYCEFADACRFDPDRDEPRFTPRLGASEAWNIIRGDGE